mmetsp:Transcript_75429/g.157278  ORF Transcript_75429/g.157278 Transcript_75429/m.157278 type:complete len:126 (+) Transcript_75429:1171-1548(+)
MSLFRQHSQTCSSTSNDSPFLGHLSVWDPPETCLLQEVQTSPGEDPATAVSASESSDEAWEMTEAVKFSSKIAARHPTRMAAYCLSFSQMRLLPWPWPFPPYLEGRIEQVQYQDKNFNQNKVCQS